MPILSSFCLDRCLKPHKLTPKTKNCETGSPESSLTWCYKQFLFCEWTMRILQQSTTSTYETIHGTFTRGSSDSRKTTIFACWHRLLWPASGPRLLLYYKKMVCHFTCFNCWGVHFEISNFLNTISFLVAFLKFTAHQDVPHVIFTENDRTL